MTEPQIAPAAGGDISQATSQTRKSRWSDPPGESSSLEAMERYAKDMERREAERLLREDDDERRMKTSAPVLNETSFDRRKVSVFRLTSQL